MPEVGPVMMYALRSDAFSKPVFTYFSPFNCLSSQSLIIQKIKLGRHALDTTFWQ